MKKQYGNQVRVDLLVKNNDGTVQTYHEDIDSIDDYLIIKITREQLQALILSEYK